MPRKCLKDGFTAADGRNLPVVDSEMLGQFFFNGNFLSPEMKNWKTLRSMRKEYGDNAIGYVQLKREGTLCELWADITPEMSVGRPAYTLHCIIDEKEEEEKKEEEEEAEGTDKDGEDEEAEENGKDEGGRRIVEARCMGCPAQLGGCKHAVAFVAWLERQSHEISPTSQKCYWAKSALAHVKDGTIFKAKDLKPQLSASVAAAKKSEFFKEVSQIFSKKNFVLVEHLAPKTSLSLFHQMIEYKEKIPVSEHSAKKFSEFVSSNMTDKQCAALARATKNQSTSSLWYDLRFGRVTASKIHEQSRCKTSDGSTLHSTLGLVKVKDTKEIKRGKKLESQVLQVVSKKKKLKRTKIGFVLQKIRPIIGASPDAIMGEYVVEVKCPASKKTFPSYFTKDFKQPSKKYLAQISLQMLQCSKKKGLFCVADPAFEKNKEVTILEVCLDDHYIDTKVDDAMNYFDSCVYPYIYSHV